MKILKSVFAVLFVATLFSSCAEEYVKPAVEVEDIQSEDGEPRKPIPLPPGTNNN